MFKTSAKNNYELIENAIIKDGFEVEKLPSNVSKMYFSENTISDESAVCGRDIYRVVNEIYLA